MPQLTEKNLVQGAFAHLGPRYRRTRTQVNLFGRGLAHLGELGMALGERLALGFLQSREPRAGVVQTRRLGAQPFTLDADTVLDAQQIAQLIGRGPLVVPD